MINGQISAKMVNGKRDIKRFSHCFEIDFDTLRVLKQRFSQDLKHGLSSDPNLYNFTPIKMLPTYLSVIPDGSQEGWFVALDLGGTNVRFFEITIVGTELQSKSQLYTLPSEIITGSANDLFDYLANIIKESLIASKMEDIHIEFLGLSFSFPCRQEAMNSATLLKWTKGFTAKGVVGENVAKLLLKSCRKQNVLIDDVVVLNDTTGTLLCGAFEDRNSVIGVINGTGTNACYLEQANVVNRLNGSFNGSQIIINTEWGAFGDDNSLKCISTKMDNSVNQESVNSGHQIFEKFVSGMYLGEIVRKAIIELNYQNNFLPSIPTNFYTKGSFETRMISLSYEKVVFIKEFKKKYDIELSDEEYEVIRDLCEKVSLRSAHLMAVGLSSIIDRLHCQQCTIAADGGIFKNHPKYIDYVESMISKLLETDKTFKIALTTDGSGKGAALAACVASSLKHQKK